MAVKQVSILIGSGFSMPEGLPSVKRINEIMRALKAEDFYLFSDQSVGFYFGDTKDPNAWLSVKDRTFAEDFTAFYCGEILNGDPVKYNYEVFYDYISDFIRDENDKDKISNFCNGFRQKIQCDKLLDDDHNLVWRFSKIFNQLIAHLLYKPGYLDSSAMLNYIPYDGFINFIKYLLPDTIVNVHTLNHDLFFDHIGSKHTDLFSHFTDGFTEYGSKFYGGIGIEKMVYGQAVHKSYMVRLKYYTGNYDAALRLFKLHGSINYVRLHFDNSQTVIRVKDDLAVSDYYYEKFDTKTRQYKYEAPFHDNEPDYLTGTTEKIKQYNEPFYKNLFSHFQTNLTKASHLIVIGYGFQDSGVNEYLEKYYLSQGKKILIIDVRTPISHLLTTFNSQIMFLRNGITAATCNELEKWYKS